MQPNYINLHKKSRRFIAMLLIVSLIIPTIYAGDDTARASKYIAAYSGILWQNSKGGLSVNFEIESTTFMTSLGASQVRFQVKENGTWTDLVTHTSSTNSSLLASDVAVHFATITYDKPVVGKTYRAVVSFYAKNASGSDSRVLTTNTVTVT